MFLKFRVRHTDSYLTMMIVSTTSIQDKIYSKNNMYSKIDCRFDFSIFILCMKEGYIYFSNSPYFKLFNLCINIICMNIHYYIFYMKSTYFVKITVNIFYLYLYHLTTITSQES